MLFSVITKLCGVQKCYLGKLCICFKLRKCYSAKNEKYPRFTENHEVFTKLYTIYIVQLFDHYVNDHYISGGLYDYLMIY